LKVGGSENGLDKEMAMSHEFLRPAFVLNQKKYYFVHVKENWKDIKVGFVGNTIRFHLFHKLAERTEDWKEQTIIESKGFLVYTFEVMIFSLIIIIYLF
jgi:hypothetical protein